MRTWLPGLRAAARPDRFFDLAAKLDLHRLAAHAQLYLSTSLPMAQEKPVLAILGDCEKQTAVAAWNPLDARPGPSWGLGEEAPLVSGPAPSITAVQAIFSEELMKLSSGNARRVDIGDRLDGPASAFGPAFWKALAADAPLTMAAIRQHGVASADYADRYFLTPLNMTLLAQVLATAPGAPKISIMTARMERPGDPGFLVFHPFANDGQRRDVMEALWPQATLCILPRPEMKHARSLRLLLGDSREVTIFLDQGFSGWRSQAAPRHDFQASATAQARAIRSASYTVRAEARETPIILWEGMETL